MTDEELKALVAENAKSIQALRSSQEKTDEQQRKTDEQLRQTDEQLRQTDEQLRQTDEQLKKTDEQLRQTDEQLKKTDEQLKKSDKKWEKISAKIDKLGELYGNSENNKGEEVEEFFYRYFEKNKNIAGIDFDEVDRNIIASERSEHDIVLINGQASALISVKYKLKEKDIDYLIEKELVRVKHFFHKLGSQHKLYGGVASYIITPEVEEYAKEKGIYVFGRSGKNVELRNEIDFQPIAL